METHERFDIIIASGGITGYAAGILLAREGGRVAVIEGFPWEWWTVGKEVPAFLNLGGGMLHGMPGSHLVTSLLGDLGIPAASAGGEGQISFNAVEPGFQVVTPRHRLSLYGEREDQLREYGREFPAGSERIGQFLRQAWNRVDERERAPVAQEGRAAGGGFVARASGLWSKLSGGRWRSATGLIGGARFPDDLRACVTLGLEGALRCRLDDMNEQEAGLRLALLATPANLNRHGQKGIFQGLRTAFRRAGGVVYRLEKEARLTEERGGVTFDSGARQKIQARWAVIDGPEAESCASLGLVVPAENGKEPWRHVMQVLIPLPADKIPEGMGHHLVLKLDDDPAPLIVTRPLLDGQKNETVLEVLTSVGVIPGPEAAAAAAARVMERLRLLLCFLPPEIQPAAVRFGYAPSRHAGNRSVELLEVPANPWSHGRLARRGRLLFAGRGDYLGSDLTGALLDGRALADWIKSSR